jgi:hypothetical protein
MCRLFFAGQKDGGTQIKLIIDYPNGVQALFKPMRSVAAGSETPCCVTLPCPYSRMQIILTLESSEVTIY